MSPVSRRRPSRRPGRTGPPGGTGADARRLRDRPPYDVLLAELRRVGGTEDAFLVEGSVGYVLGLLDPRGPGAGESFATFCREALGDPRAGTSVPGLEVVTVLARLGHPAVRADAEALLAGCHPDLRAGLPAWCAQVGLVHVVEAGSLRTADGSETVLHVMLDYDDPAAGSRHLLSVAVEHREERVHLLDVRGRGASDSLVPVAESYAGSDSPVWSWHGTDEVEALVAGAVRATGARTSHDWPVVDLEGAPTPAWTLGVRRLEQVTGAVLRP